MSGLWDANQEGLDASLKVINSLPLDPIKPEPKRSVWSTIPRAVVAAGSEVLGNLTDISQAYGQTTAAYGAPSATPLGQTDKEKVQSEAARAKIDAHGIDWQPAESRDMYGFARYLRPDPLTAGAAENIAFSLTKGLTKAIGAGAVLGPVGGATAFGTSEGMTTAEDLAAQGVDRTTRTKVGAVVGVLNAAGMALPIAGNTFAKTAALVAVGGPGSFVAQQAATRSILENANYHDLAQQYDPLDPTGLALATLLPAGFAAWTKGAQIRAAFSKKAPDAAVTPETGTIHPTPEQIDALMVHNLTSARDAHEAVTPDQVVEKLGKLTELNKSADANPTGSADATGSAAPVEQGQSVDLNQQADSQPAFINDPHIASIVDRAESLKNQQPDMPVALKEDGTHATAADELAAIRKQSKEGTPDTLGADDAPLLKIAAECFLAMGAA